MIMGDQQMDVMRGAVAETGRDHWILYLIEGVVLVLLGLLSGFMPPLLGTILFGWLFVVAGTAGLITTFVTRQTPGFLWSLLSAILAIGVGLMIFAQPMLGMVALI